MTKITLKRGKTDVGMDAGLLGLNRMVSDENASRHAEGTLKNQEMKGSRDGRESVEKEKCCVARVETI